MEKHKVRKKGAYIFFYILPFCFLPNTSEIKENITANTGYDH